MPDPYEVPINPSSIVCPRLLCRKASQIAERFLERMPGVASPPEAIPRQQVQTTQPPRI